MKRIPTDGPGSDDGDDDEYHEILPWLYVGDSGAARTAGRRFDRVVSVAEGLEVEATTDSFDLTVDESVLDMPEEFAAAVAAVRSCGADERVLVHCYEGRERAPTVAAAALAERTDVSFDEALDAVRRRRSIVAPTPPLRELGRRYLSATASGADVESETGDGREASGGPE